ncbi:MAG: hypothetical protein K0R47_841 [Brevibacillus sp.]|nr:hypothetical protein [Brevibacillus sp.]
MILQLRIWPYDWIPTWKIDRMPLIMMGGCMIVNDTAIKARSDLD